MHTLSTKVAEVPTLWSWWGTLFFSQSNGFWEFRSGPLAEAVALWVWYQGMSASNEGAFSLAAWVKGCNEVGKG